MEGLFKETCYDLQVEKEMKEQAMIERKRQERIARMDRLLDPRNRTMGVDVEHLKEQERVKALRAAEAQAQAAQDDSERRTYVAAATEMERRQEADRRRVTQDAAAVIMDQMTRKTQADSWDLNDPARVRNSMPARVGIDDPRLGPASAQVFSGEDVLGPERRALQKAQFAAWVSQAHAEKEAKKAAEKEELTTYARRMAEVVKVADELETAISDLGKQRQADAAATNLRMAAENLEKKKAEREWEQQASVITMNTLTTVGAGMGLLAEDYGDGISASNPNRLRPDHYRGVPPSANSETARQYRQQIEEKAHNKIAARERELQLAAEYQEGIRAAAKLERAQVVAAKQAQDAQRAALEAQREEQRRNREAEKALFRAPGFGKEFFEAFGRP